MKCHTNNNQALKVCTRVTDIKQCNGNYAAAFYVELTNNNFSESDIWAMADALDRNDENIINAIIRAKAVTVAAVFFMLKLAKFPVTGCELAFRCYDDEYLKNRLMKETFGIFHETFLTLKNIRKEAMHCNA